MGREEREHKRAGETGRECEEMTDTKWDGGKEIEREWKERKESGSNGKREMKKEKVIEIKVWRAHDR